MYPFEDAYKHQRVIRVKIKGLTLSFLQGETFNGIKDLKGKGYKDEHVKNDSGRDHSHSGRISL